METDVRGERGTSGAAIASLVLGIVGVTVFPLIPSVLALVFGSRVRDEMRADPGVSGEGLATAASSTAGSASPSAIGLLFVVVGLAVFFAV